jgi:alkylhydroperoxidase family enzyme
MHGVKETDIATVKAAGFSDAEVVELVGLVALNTFSNYINIAFRTDVDFPAVNVSLVD